MRFSKKEMAVREEVRERLLEKRGRCAKCCGWEPSDRQLDELRLIEIQRELAPLLEQDYKAVKIFVVFEHQDAQRRCLQAMTVGTIPAAFDIKNESVPLFRGTNVLEVIEPAEPEQIIYQNLHFSPTQIMLGEAVTFTATILLVAGSFIVVAILKSNAYSEQKQEVPSQKGSLSAIAATIWVALSNSIVPTVLSMLSDVGSPSPPSPIIAEVLSLVASSLFAYLLTPRTPPSVASSSAALIRRRRQNEVQFDIDQRQRSTFRKFVLFRILNTCFVIYVLTPYEFTLRPEYIEQVVAILTADAVTAPLLRFLNIPVRFKKYIATKVFSQAKMNALHVAPPLNIAEIYSNVVKTAVLSLFFCATIPIAQLWLLVACFTCYWVDLYCIFNIFTLAHRKPDVQVAVETRKMLAYGVVFHLLVTLDTYEGWPYDYICKARPVWPLRLLPLTSHFSSLTSQLVVFRGSGITTTALS